MTLPAMSTQPDFISPDEYLRRERMSDFRSEYLGGRIVAMSGASRAHNLIVFNLGGHLHAHLRGQGCEGYVADMKVRLAGSLRYVYPDLVVVCGEPEFQDEKEDVVANPLLVIEVLSDSTEAFDRGEKWNGYRRIPSLAEYVLIAQHRPQVERFVRQGELWTYDSAEGLDAAVTLSSIGLTLPLHEIYEGVPLSDHG